MRMHDFEVLCTTTLNSNESAFVDLVAKRLQISREMAIRKAVAFFSAQCVPTQSAKKRPSNIFRSMCTHTRRGTVRKAAKKIQGNKGGY